MTRLFTDGAEMQDVLFWDNRNTVGIGTGWKSGYCYSGAGGNAYKNIPDLSEFYYRVRAYTDYVATNNYLFHFRHDATDIAKVSMGTGNRFTYYSGGAAIVTSSMVEQINTWYLIEVYFKMDDAPNGRMVIKIDGITIIDYTGDTKPGADTHINNVGWSAGTSVVGVDDLALNDTDNSDGKNDNSWCGDGHIYRITPSGSSATTNNWVNNGGVSASANYLYVDEYPNDGDTTYVYCSGSNTGTQDQYAMTNLGLSSTTQIYRVWTEARAKKSDTSDTYIKIGVLPNGGTDSVSGSIPLTTSYTAITGSYIKINPFTSASWTNADLDGLEAVIEMG